jgi:hypothetical protein
LTICAILVIKSWFCLILLSLIGVLSIGYGRFDPINDDKPSFLGKLAYKLFPKSQVLQDVTIRGMVGILMCISILVIPFLKHNWIIYLIGCIIILGSYCGISWQAFGEIKFKDKELLISDLIHYTVINCGILLVILW